MKILKVSCRKYLRGTEGGCGGVRVYVRFTYFFLVGGCHGGDDGGGANEGVLY